MASPRKHRGRRRKIDGGKHRRRDLATCRAGERIIWRGRSAGEQTKDLKLEDRENIYVERVSPDIDPSLPFWQLLGDL
ncbi:hypothetical protein LDENG_00013460 [Lucifuga dentata]|nr:hypothetical protein LDENG_00013460 [Lucifuga dentata]